MTKRWEEWTVAGRSLRFFLKSPLTFRAFDFSLGNSTRLKKRGVGGTRGVIGRRGTKKAMLTLVEYGSWKVRAILLMIEPRGSTTAAFCPMAGRGPTPEPPLPVVVAVVVVVYCFKAAPSRITFALLSERERESERGFNQWVPRCQTWVTKFGKCWFVTYVSWKLLGSIKSLTLYGSHNLYEKIPISCRL